MKRIFAILICLLAAVGCSTPGNGAGDVGEEGATGTLNLPLSSQTGNTVYVLTNVTFKLTGTPLGKETRTIVLPPPTPPSDTSFVTPLGVGSYALQLLDGWELRVFDPVSGGLSKPVEAKLLSQNPAPFEITRNNETILALLITTNNGTVVQTGGGKLRVVLNVSDCDSYNNYSAAIATQTVDCTGSIGPKDFQINADGLLQRAFDACPALPASEVKEALQTIDQLLTLQSRPDKLPFGKSCIAGRWQRWQDAFFQAGSHACPNWVKQQTFFDHRMSVPGTLDVLSKFPLGVNSADSGLATGSFKEESLYDVSFKNEAPPSANVCATPAQCALDCAAGFPGFTINTRANASSTSVLTDPTYWLVPNFYANGTSPFKPAYYHPMSFYGALPGDAFGHYNRRCEPCSYYLSGAHRLGTLDANCLVQGVVATCISECKDSTLPKQAICPPVP